MSSCCSDEESAFCLFLAMDESKINPMIVSRIVCDIEFFSWFYNLLSCDDIDRIGEALKSNNLYFRNDTCFWDIGCGEKNTFVPEFTSKYCSWESSLDQSYGTIECEFTQKKGRLSDRIQKIDLFPEDTERYRKIIDRSFFLQICRCKVHRYPSSSGELISSIFYRTPHTLSTFLYGSITESDDVKLSHTSDHIHLYFNEISDNTVHGSRIEFLHTIECREKYCIIITFFTQ